MKIFFNSFLNTNKSIKKAKSPSYNFFNEKISFKSQLKEDFFEEKLYMDEECGKRIFAYEELDEDTKELLLENYAAYGYFNCIKRILPKIKGNLSFLVISEINKNILLNISPKNREKIRKLLEKIGANNKQTLVNLVNLNGQIVKKEPNLISDYDVLEICAQVKDFNAILNFSTILTTASMHNRSEGKKSDFQEIIDFMAKIGIKNEAEFFNRYGFLAKSFDNFSTQLDKLYAYDYIRNTYQEKSEAIDFIKSRIPKFKTLDTDKFYRKYGEVIDYLYEEQNNFFFLKLIVLISYLEEQQEQIQPNAYKIMSDLGNIKTPQGQYELYDFLIEEDISIKELNILTKCQHIADIDLTDIVINRNNQVVNLIGQFGFSYDIAVEFYTKFAQTITTINNSDDSNYALAPMLVLFKGITELNIKDEKELIKLYSDISNTNKDKKTKKKNNNNGKKITQKELLDFIELLGFIDPKMAQMHKKERSYQLLKELKNKKAEFEKISSQLEKLIDEKHARYLCRSSFFVFSSHYDLYKKNRNLNSFLDKVIEIKKEEMQGKETEYFRYNKLLEFFKNENMLEEFLIKNNIYLNDENDNHSATCLRVLDILFKDKSDEELKKICEKLVKTNFIKDSKNAFAGYISSKSDKEIGIIFDIALNENFKTIHEFSSLISPYVGKQKKINNILAHYKKQDMSFREYIQKISQLQKEIDNTGFSIKIDNENIEIIQNQDLKERKLTTSRIMELLKEFLDPNSKTNFLCGLNNSLLTTKQQYSSNKIAQEIIYSKTKYKEEYSGFINNFNLNAYCCNFNPSKQEQCQSSLINEFENNLKHVRNFINSDHWLPKFADKKIPNLCLHAKMRLIDRFILQENKDLFSLETEKELKEILKTIYTDTPYKIESSDKASALYFKHKDYEIKAVFNPTGEMITIAKNKL